MMFGAAKPVQQISLDGCPKCGAAPVISGEHVMGNGSAFQWVYCHGCQVGVRVYGGDYDAWNQCVRHYAEGLVKVVDIA